MEKNTSIRLTNMEVKRTTKSQEKSLYKLIQTLKIVLEAE